MCGYQIHENLMCIGLYMISAMYSYDVYLELISVVRIYRHNGDVAAVVRSRTNFPIQETN